MRYSPERIRHLCASRGITVTELLRRSQVSRTAFYSLMRRPSIIPESATAIAATLGHTELDLLEVGSRADVAARARARLARKICSADSEIAFENAWHTLTLLEMTPVERLEGSLRRGRAPAVQP